MSTRVAKEGSYKGSDFQADARPAGCREGVCWGVDSRQTELWMWDGKEGDRWD